MTDQHLPLPPRSSLVVRPQSARTHEAIAQLQLSRQRLAQRLLPQPAERADHGTNAAASDNWFSQTSEWLKRWIEQSPAAPLWQSAQAFGQHWWQRQAWRPGVQAAGGVLRSRVAPWVQQHPVLSLGLAAGLSAALVWGRPWAHPFVRTRARQARRQVWRWAVREAGVVPVHLLVPTLLAAWGALAARQASARADADRAESPAAAAGAPAAGGPGPAHEAGPAAAAPSAETVAAGT